MEKTKVIFCCFIIANYRLLFCKASSQKYLVGLVLVTMKMVKDAKGFCQIPTGIKRNIKRQVFFFFSCASRGTTWNKPKSFRSITNH